MNTKHIALATAIATILSAPAFSNDMRPYMSASLSANDSSAYDRRNDRYAYWGTSAEMSQQNNNYRADYQDDRYDNGNRYADGDQNRAHKNKSAGKKHHNHGNHGAAMRDDNMNRSDDYRK